MKKWIRMAGVILLMTGLMCIVTACRQDTEEKSIYIKEFEPLTEVKEGRPDIYMILKALNNSYWEDMKVLAAAAAEEQECNLFFSASEVETEWEAQKKLLEMAADAGADAVIIAPDDSALLSEVIEAIHSRKIPVILIDTTITTDSYDVSIMTDNLLLGQKAAAEMIRRLKGKGYTSEDQLDIGIQAGSVSSQTINERLAGFCQYWTLAAPQRWNILDDVKVNHGDLALAESYGKEILDNYESVKGLFGCNNGSTVGLAKAIHDRQRTDVVLVGLDYSDEIAELIASPDYHASTMLQKQGAMAKMSVEAALAVLNGRKIEKKFMDTGVITVNEENVNDPEVQSVLQGH